MVHPEAGGKVGWWSRPCDQRPCMLALSSESQDNCHHELALPLPLPVWQPSSPLTYRQPKGHCSPRKCPPSFPQSHHAAWALTEQFFLFWADFTCTKSCCRVSKCVETGGHSDSDSALRHSADLPEPLSPPHHLLRQHSSPGRAPQLAAIFCKVLFSWWATSLWERVVGFKQFLEFLTHSVAISNTLAVLSYKETGTNRISTCGLLASGWLQRVGCVLCWVLN